MAEFVKKRPYPAAFVTEKGERFLKAGHVWVYGEEIVRMMGEPENGSVCDVYTGKGRWLGAGLYSEASKIRVRIMSKNPNDKFDEAFWERRLRYAVAYRRQVMGPDFPACRLIHGEADQFPGLTADLMNDVLVLQVLSVGMERLKEMLADRLVAILGEYGVRLRAVVERSDVAVRKLEGLEEEVRVMRQLDPGFDGFTEIRENGILYRVDVLRGQKTGFFLDQKYNRRAAARLAEGRVVLDCFTHVGSFALNCAAAGAKRVTAVDISASAVEEARQNAARNGLDGTVEAVEADVFAYLTALADGKNSPFDYIILDPPAFTKSRGTVDSAARGYREINRRAMQLLPRGGYLATCSCSHFMTDDLFRQMLRDAAADAGVSLRQIEARQQAPDHPILWGVPETEYLKFYLFQVV